MTGKQIWGIREGFMEEVFLENLYTKPREITSNITDT